jgi:hypothetical protein
MGKPKPEDPKNKPIYDKIIATSKEKPVDLEGEKKSDPKEQGWLLDEKLFMGLLTSIPYSDDDRKNKRSLQDVPIGGMDGGWLDAKAKPVLVAAFKSVPIDQKHNTTKPKNYTGILTYQGCYLLWRHALHGNHDSRGRGPDIGRLDAIEGFKLTADIAGPYVQKKMK